ncbi:hypothetical protein KSP39_PZI009778 [Platanthera zijinensis]|uniref:CRIB domain-containing protein n=1 Tax=Platanthera zijinensis TaxID=2320716 RepID=A0AAP0G6C9_9ASPA
MIVNNKMKGLLKGLRYISQIFDEEEEEKELQIGYPTDVKHVAHIGCDGTSTDALSWVNEEISQLWLDSTHSSSIDQHPNSPAKRRHRRRSSATESSLEADRPPNREKDLSKHGNRQSRRHHSAGSASDSSGKQPSNENFRRNRRHSKPSSIASESSVQDVPSVPRQSRHRNSKEESNATASIASAGIP